MQSRLKMSREGLELLKSFEGLRLTAARLPDGRWTMGHGHTQYAREGAVIGEADAEALLLYDLIPVVAAVNDAVAVPISQNQFDALVCFAFNVGVEAFRASEVLTRVNQERMTEAALAMAIWRAGAFNGRRIVLDALVRRRSAEEALMLGAGMPPSPSDLVRPQVDPAAESALPQARPADLDVDFTGAEAHARLVENTAPDVEAQPAAVEAVAPPPAQVPEPTSSTADPVVNEALMSPQAPPPSPTVSETSVSTRVYATYPTQTFAPLSAAEPVVDEGQPIDLGDQIEPAVSSELAEPPLVLVLTPPAETLEVSEPAAAANDILEAPVEGQEALFETELPAAAQDGEIIFYDPEAGVRDSESRWRNSTAYVAMGVVGLGAFGFGVAGFQLASQNPAPGGAFDEKTMIAWILVGIGVVCVWISAYNLFQRLAGPDAE